jgi:tetratricopeptide (TPR) repeat protein
VRNDGRFRWSGRVHETLVATRPPRLQRAPEVLVVHQPLVPKTADAQGRNLALLRAEEPARDAPRTRFYLARELGDAGDIDGAAAAYETYLAGPGWDEERYVALTELAALHRSRERHAEATAVDLRAASLFPEWSSAYFGLAKTAHAQRRWADVVGWTDQARRSRVPDGLHFVDHAAESFGWILPYTEALHELGRTSEALQFTKHALQIRPDDRAHRENFFFFAGRLAHG